MLKAIRHGLTNLTKFSGRDARQAFWYYVLFLVIINMVVGFLMTIPMMATAFETAIQSARMGIPEDQVAVQMTAQMADQVETTMWVSLATNVASTFLLAASFVRRLHDSDHSGWWAVPAVAAQIVAAVYSVNQVGRVKELMTASVNPQDMAAYFDNQMQMMGYGLIGWIGPLIVIIFGVMKSTEGPNRFGDAPFTA